MTEYSPEWVFRPVDGDGENRQDPSQDAFDDLSIDNFVRESLQNSNDAIEDYRKLTEKAKKGVVKYGISRNKARYENTGRPTPFLKSMGWNTLEEHINSQPDNTVGERTKDFVNELENEIRILTVEDRNAIGLTGSEKSDPDEESRFADLIRNIRWSAKTGEDAGGSHGMGKAVYWAFSGLSTVFFNSIPAEEEWEDNSPRFIGRSKISTHKLDGVKHKDSGYFGKVTGEGKDRSSDSIVGEGAHKAAEELNIDRSGKPGTTVMIPGFQSPSSTEDIADEELEEKIKESVARNFWPAMTREDLEVLVDHEREEKIDPEEFDELKPFIKSFKAYRNEDFSEELENRGEVVRETFEVPLPNYKEGKEPEDVSRSELPDTAEVTLVIRLSTENDSEELQNRIAKFRGPGMVIDPEYDRLTGVNGARPFHALLIAGTSRTTDGVSRSDRELEKVLKKSEPISHDRWSKRSEDLKNTYVRNRKSKNMTNYSETLSVISEKTNDILRDLVVEEVEGGEPLPYELRKRLKVSGGTGPTDRGPKPLHLSGGEGSYRNGKWYASGEAGLNEEAVDGEPAWKLKIELFRKGEDGKKYDKIDVGKPPSVENPDLETYTEEGKAVIEFPSGITETDFELESVELDSEPSKVGLNADAESIEVTK